MTKPIVALTFIFSFLFLSTTALAYLPIDKNVSTTMPNGAARLDCLNNTGVFYCYVTINYVGYPNRIYRYNETLGAEAFCEVDGGLDTTPPYSAFLMNSTTMRIMTSTNSMDYNISTLDTGTCANVTGFLGDGAGAGQFSNGNTYFPQNWIYHIDLGIVNTTYGSVMTNWLDSMTRMVMFPNHSDNATIYTVERNITATDVHGNYIKYTNGAVAGNFSNPNVYWGVPNSQGRSSLVKVNATTTWLYYLADYARIYRMNFSMVDSVGNGTVIEPAANGIQNTTVYGNYSNVLAVWLTASCNGTITWYLDGVSLGTTTITTAPHLLPTFYSYATGLMTVGAHNWQANFTDDCPSNIWYTPKTYFTYEQSNAWNTIGQGIANGFGVSLDNGKMFFAFLLAAVISGALAYYVNHSLFIPAFAVSIIAFAFLGFFPVWVTILMIILAGFIFIKYAGVI